MMAFLYVVWRVSEITLVTGGAGFVGHHLVNKLREQGQTVRSYDLSAPRHCDDIQGSVLDTGEVASAMVGVSSIFHLAGNAQLWATDNSVFNQVNFIGTKNIVDSAIAAGARKLVHCSSLTTLVGAKTPIGESSVDETQELLPEDMLGEYPRSKLLAERYALSKKGALEVVSAIPTEPLGPGDNSLTPPTKMILDFANGKTPAYIDCTLNFVPVASLADGLIAVQEKGQSGERYLLGGDNTPMSKLLNVISEMTGRKMPGLKAPYAFALLAGFIDTKLVAPIMQKPPKAPLTGVRLAGRQVSFSSEKAARELGWKATAFEPALQAMLNWADEEGLLLGA
ncbi:MAG: dihydroflavonol-4-reductase [Hyphococcus sp.]|nr:MAG: dihydroflavonol-4-reductase [Marinicaulis sp.]